MALNLYDKILRDARVKLTELFDRNFTEQGFFGRKWVATQVSKVNGQGKRGSILIVTGQMRRSIRSAIKGKSIVFTSDLPYTALHNEGGKFAVKVRSHTRRRGGERYDVRSHSRQIDMPQRQFIGDHAKVQQALGDIVARNLEEFSRNLHKKHAAKHR